MRNMFFAATALAAAMMVGCKEEPKKTPAPAPAPAPATQPSTESSETPPATPSTPSTPATPATPATQPSGSTPATPGVTLPSTPAIPTIPTTPSAPATPSTPSTETPAAGADDMQTKAKKWLDDANKALKAGKFDEAQKIVEKLDGIKSSLSPEWQTKIDNLKSAVDKAKNLKVPGLN